MMIRRRGFTLLEVMLSLSLVVLLLSILFQFYRNTLEHRQRGLAAVQEAHLARVLLRQITDEI
ncbi:MAG: prepilin-type N-terminal cleavage/methylation domain-containing protein, partial [Planctomycetes bacterium]|nr:prepilin-type N-terminal cleavage/methylation domain-containing protein [Planctomycetota bacterium]